MALPETPLSAVELAVIADESVRVREGVSGIRLSQDAMDGLVIPIVPPSLPLVEKTPPPMESLGSSQVTE